MMWMLNRHLTDWLVEYNFNRPHQSLGYATPIEFLTEKLDEKVLPTVPYPCEKLTSGIR
jgi:transposase InsO family protein